MKSPSDDEVVRNYMVQLGTRGGDARARALSPQQRSDGARLAAQARWRNYRLRTRKASKKDT